MNKLTRPLVSVACCLGALVATAKTAHAAGGASFTSMSSGWCRDTTSPGVIIANDTAELVWDVYGNLTLSNNRGSGTLEQWGIGSDTALTGSAAANLCFDASTGFLRIADAAGSTVWTSGPYGLSQFPLGSVTAPNATLVLNQCSLRIKNGSSVVWQKDTPACDRHSYAKPSQDVCWPTSSSKQKILWDDDEALELSYTAGQLTLFRDGAPIWSPTLSAGTPAQVCYQADGNLVVYDASHAALWASGSNDPSATQMSLDPCGIGFANSGNRHDLYARVNVSLDKCEATSVKNSWCRTKHAAGTLLAGASTHLDWTSDGYLKLYDATGVVWKSSNPSGSGDHLCFQHDGNLVIFNAAGSAPGNVVWSSGTRDGMYADTLSLDRCSLMIAKGAAKAACDEKIEAHQAIPEDDVKAMACALNDDYVSWSMSAPSCTVRLPGGGFSFLKDLRAGSSDFGAEMWVVAAATNATGLDALRASVAGTRAAGQVAADVPSGAPPAGYLEALGGAGISATLFGQTSTLLDANGYIGNIGGAVYSFELTAVGLSVSLSEIGVANPAVSATFATAQQEYVVLGIPVTAPFEVPAELGANVDVTADSGGLTLTETPYAQLDVDASVGVGVSGLSAGVEGSLNLVTISIPLSQSLAFSTGKYTSTGKLQISTLSGEIDLYAEALIAKATKEIASFDGYSTTTSLFSQSGSL